MSERRHLLVTNDFPPKIGGIQSYLWELWSRLDPTTFQILTARSDPNSAEFDEEQRARGIIIHRVERSTLFFPTKGALRAIESVMESFHPDLVILDPAFPLGSLVRKITGPTALILHGAEVTIPGKIPGAKRSIRRSLREADGLIAAGPFPRREAENILSPQPCPPILEIPPGVDTSRFAPSEESARLRLRRDLGIGGTDPLVVSVSRLVPRKGMDVLVKAATLAQQQIPNLRVVIGGTGRDEKRLHSLIQRERAPVSLVGRVSDEGLPELLGASDLFVMDCRSRWAGLEQEGFGIVFLEAAACGVAQVAGQSGGSADAVIDGETGIVLKDPSDPGELARAMVSLLGDPARLARLGRAGQDRAKASFDYDVLARRLGGALAEGWPKRHPGE